MADKKGLLFVLSAPSGGGKSSLAKALVASEPDIAVAVSHTTRAPRPGEEHGVHYFYVSPAQFEAMVAAGDFLEHARVFDNHYGTSKQAVQSLLDAGKHVLLDIDWQGMRAIKQQQPTARSIFILPPTRQELETRLRGRGQDSEEIIARRMRDAISEMQHYHEFDYVVVNDDFEAALTDLRAIIRGRDADVRPLHIDIPALLSGEKGD